MTPTTSFREWRRSADPRVMSERYAASKSRGLAFALVSDAMLVARVPYPVYPGHLKKG